MTPAIEITATLANQRVLLGYQRMWDAIVLHGGDLRQLLIDLGDFENQGAARATSKFDLFNGALMCLLDVWSQMVRGGMHSTSNDKQIEKFLNGTRTQMLLDLALSETSDIKLFHNLIYGLCYSVNNSRAHMRFVAPKPAPVAEKVQAVRIVSEPDRITTQTVQRDANMEIVSTTTRTTDARAL